MPPQNLRPYVKRNKNDSTDAEAICEAVTRSQMRFVPVKSAEQQSVLMLHRARAPMIRQRTMLVNAMGSLRRARHCRDARRLKQLEEENQRLKKLVADFSLDKAMLQDVIRRKIRGLPGSGRSSIMFDAPGR